MQELFCFDDFVLPVLTTSKSHKLGGKPRREYLELMPTIFLCFTKRKHFDNNEKCFLFYLKSSFHSRDIQRFVFCSLLFDIFQIQRVR